MQLLIPCKGGPMDGKRTLAIGRTIQYGGAKYRMVTVGACRIPAYYKFLPAFLLSLAILSLGGCGSAGLTVAPKPVTAHAVSSWARENVLAADARGVLVTTEWVRVYHALLTTYGDRLPVSNRPASPDAGIAALAYDRFRVSYEVSDRFVEMKFIERNGTP